MPETSRPTTEADSAYRKFCGHHGSRFKIKAFPGSPSPARLYKNACAIPTRTAEIRTNADTEALSVPLTIRLYIP